MIERQPLEWMATAESHAARVDAGIRLARITAAGELDPSDVEWLRQGLCAWVNDQASPALGLARHLRIPSTPAGARRAIRDANLRAASASIGGGQGWAAAAELQVEIDRFRRQRWPTWQHLQRSPAGARPIDILLLTLFRSSVDLPATTQQLANILGDDQIECTKRLGKSTLGNGSSRGDER